MNSLYVLALVLGVMAVCVLAGYAMGASFTADRYEQRESDALEYRLRVRAARTEPLTVRRDRFPDTGELPALYHQKYPSTERYVA